MHRPVQRRQTGERSVVRFDQFARYKLPSDEWVEERDKGVGNELVSRAWAIAREVHKDQSRDCGESYLSHVARVTNTVARIFNPLADGYDATLAAAMLHDVVEDSPLIVLHNTMNMKQQSLSELLGGTEHVNEVVIPLVDRLTHRKKIEEREEYYLQRLLSKKERGLFCLDYRAGIIKLADRVDNANREEVRLIERNFSHEEKRVREQKRIRLVQKIVSNADRNLRLYFPLLEQRLLFAEDIPQNIAFFDQLRSLFWHGYVRSLKALVWDEQRSVKEIIEEYRGYYEHARENKVSPFFHIANLIDQNLVWENPVPLPTYNKN